MDYIGHCAGAQQEREGSMMPKTKSSRVYVSPRQPRQGKLKTTMDRFKHVLRQRVKTMKRRRGKP